MDDDDLAWVDVKRDVMDEYNDELQTRLDGVEVWQAGVQRLLPRRRSHRHAVAGIDERVPRPHRASRPRRIRDVVSPRLDDRPVRLRLGPWTSASPSRTPVATRHPSGCASTARPRSKLGFDSLWGVDHLVMPQHTDSDYTLGRKPAKIADDAVSGPAVAELRDDDHAHVGRRVHRAGEARHRGRGAADPQRGAQRAGPRHPRRVLRRPRRLRRRRRVAARGSRGDGHAVGPARAPAARSTSR